MPRRKLDRAFLNARACAKNFLRDFRDLRNRARNIISKKEAYFLKVIPKKEFIFDERT